MIKKNPLLFLWKDKIDNTLSQSENRKKLPKSRIKREHHYNPFRNQWILSKFYEDLYPNKLDDLGKVDRFLEKYKY